MSTPRSPRPADRGSPALPRRLRWLQPLLALVGLASLPPALPARALDSTAPIQHVPELRARLLAAEQPAGGPTADVPPADDRLALWKKWNDWNNWAKWAKQ